MFRFSIAFLIAPHSPLSCWVSGHWHTAVKKRVEDVMPIATGHEREELAAELEVKKILEDVNNPVGPFGTKIYPFEFGPLFDGVTPFFLLLETGNVDLYEIVSDALTFDGRNHLSACRKEAPAVVKSYYDKRIVGCPGGEGGMFLSLILCFCLYKFELRMSMMLFAFDWRKASCMSVQFVHSILCWKLEVLEDLRMDMETIIINCNSVVPIGIKLE
ncbi:cytochrome c oxidase subunit 5b-2, mitochondrial isoform X2 [Gossypium australe]|uniref:Cytochrome c oxidase subunit 5b-2, mitochondrial isoform X2 n=1 Tax=Gossypium australe TaxID=47621 RepID=A0A5B6X8L0_9ROSI|nr:cytochrome c oxidase subunit 5b-2, mitochondrial isoform X2 [Gossypium australe]